MCNNNNNNNSWWCWRFRSAGSYLRVLVSSLRRHGLGRRLHEGSHCILPQCYGSLDHRSRRVGSCTDTLHQGHVNAARSRTPASIWAYYDLCWSGHSPLDQSWFTGPWSGRRMEAPRVWGGAWRGGSSRHCEGSGEMQSRRALGQWFPHFFNFWLSKCVFWFWYGLSNEHTIDETF